MRGALLIAFVAALCFLGEANVPFYNCTVTFKDGFDCSPFTPMESFQPLLNYPWQERQCKIRDQFGKPNPDPCLWQRCITEGNLRQGAIDYYYGTSRDMDAASLYYCKIFHCHNLEFNFNTTVAEADAYCDKTFGKVWRLALVGRNGYGPPGPGTGIWECAHSNLQCDWAHCQLHFCPGGLYYYGPEPDVKGKKDIIYM